jgi:hypothetical protein
MTDNTFDPAEYVQPGHLKDNSELLRAFWEDAQHLAAETGIDPRMAYMGHVHLWCVPSLYCTGST